MTPAATITQPRCAPQHARVDARGLADKTAMQHLLFAELSRMFGQEVPLYDKALLVNAITNRAVCDLLSRLHRGFEIDDATLERTSGERHGAIRIGTPEEYRWVGRFFAAFDMEPHNFYDMTAVGSKSQPIIATAFRSRQNPEHRVFTSLLMTDYFSDATKAKLDAILAQRTVFSETAKKLIEQGERDGGLSWADADALIREATTRMFKWTGRANDHALYKELCQTGFKIAADIACFERHHLNHLTPNTFCIDLYTSAMKHALGEIDAATFGQRARAALTHLAHHADRDYLRLTFRHLTPEGIEQFAPADQAAGVRAADQIAQQLTHRLASADVHLSTLAHSGFKEFTEGPSRNIPVLLRQDAYKALTEPVVFTNPDGTTTRSSHTARFGEIEQRFYACTPKGRAVYDACLSAADDFREKNKGIEQRDHEAYTSGYDNAFASFPQNLQGLLDQGLVYAKYSPTAMGLARKGTLSTNDLATLLREGFVRREGLRYEDFLPVSAAGIFASNLSQYGTASTAKNRPTYTQSDLEAILGRSIIDAVAAYEQTQERSLTDTFAALGLRR